MIAADWIAHMRRSRGYNPAAIQRGVRRRYPGVSLLEAFRAVSVEDVRRRELRAWWAAHLDPATKIPLATETRR